MAATFASNPVAPFGSPPARTYTELRIQTQLLCEIHKLLARMLGPSVVDNNLGADLSGDVDAWRSDPTFLGQ